MSASRSYVTFGSIGVGCLRGAGTAPACSNGCSSPASSARPGPASSGRAVRVPEPGHASPDTGGRLPGQLLTARFTVRIRAPEPDVGQNEIGHICAAGPWPPRPCPPPARCGSELSKSWPGSGRTFGTGCLTALPQAAASCPTLCCPNAPGGSRRKGLAGQTDRLCEPTKRGPEQARRLLRPFRLCSVANWSTRQPGRSWNCSHRSDGGGRATKWLAPGRGPGPGPRSSGR